ncbi:MAG: hypothetical protein J6B77_07035, partial [Clostridia bacterium]|nr:hypothetical protein [Clostridia bacterium]
PETDDTVTVTVTVTDVRIVTVDGNSRLYLTGDDGVVYRGAFDRDESLILIAVGDKVTLKVVDTDHERIKEIRDWSTAE